MKKALSLILVACLLLGAVPMTAHAQTVYYWPVMGHTNLSRGYQSGHEAIDIADSSITGALVYATMSGTVYARYSCTENHYGSSHTCDGFGTGLIIKGDDGRFYHYAHMQANSIPSAYTKGTYVSAGANIGRVGNTGNSNGAHLHFAISSGSSAWSNFLNPMTLSYSYSLDSSETPDPSITWNIYEDKYWVGSTNAVLGADVNLNIDNTAITTCGVALYNQGGTKLASKTETWSGSGGYTQFYMWYDVNSELGCTLTPGGTYKYQFFLVIYGKTYYSPTYTFTTSGTHTHTYNAGVITKEATCTASGTKVRTCTICGTTITETIAATGHSWNAATCTAPQTCTICGQTSGSAAGHNYNSGSVTSAAGCTATGVKTYTCNACGNKKTEIIAATGHSWNAATCTAPKTCTACGATEGVANGHKYDDRYDVACNVCGFNRLSQNANLSFVADPGLSFQDYIGMQVMVPVATADKYDSIWVEAVQADPAGNVTTILEGSLYYGVYMVYDQQILSWSMTENVTMTLYAEKDGLIYVGQTVSASVQDLAMTKILSYYSDGNTKVVTTLVDMLNYGTAVQTAFSYNTGSLPTAKLGIFSDLGTTATPNFAATNNKTGNASVACLKDSISMQAKVEIQLMFAGDISAYTVKATVGGADAPVVIDTETMGAYGWTIVRVAVSAAKMRDTYTIALYDANGNPVTQVYEVSVEAYGKAQLTTAYRDVIIAMMRYGDSVAAL